MYNILVVDQDVFLANELSSALGEAYFVRTCTDRNLVLDVMQKFAPCVLVVDLWTLRSNAMSIIRTILAAGFPVRIIPLLKQHDRLIIKELTALGIAGAMMKPCSIEALARKVYDYCRVEVTSEEWMQTERLEKLLLDLGFTMNLNGFKCCCFAILEWYHANGLIQSKQLYPEVAKRCGGSATRAEKAIRDAKMRAFANGNTDLWKLYFPVGKSGKLECPTNEEFIARMAAALSRCTNEDNDEFLVEYDYEIM